MTNKDSITPSHIVQIDSVSDSVVFMLDHAGTVWRRVRNLKRTNPEDARRAGMMVRVTVDWDPPELVHEGRLSSTSVADLAEQYRINSLQEADK
jgi:hypothetical protein